MILILRLIRPLFAADNAAFAATWNGQKVQVIKGFMWCRRRELNSRPTVYKTAALPLSYAGKPNRNNYLSMDLIFGFAQEYR